MSTDKPRFTVTLDDDLFDEVEQFRYDNRYPNRSMAINALLKAGVDALKDQDDKSIKKATRKRKSKETGK